MLRGQIAVLAVLLLARNSYPGPAIQAQGGEATGMCASDDEVCPSEVSSDGPFEEVPAESPVAVDALAGIAGTADVEAASGRTASKSATGKVRRKSTKPECQATLGPRDDPFFLEKVRPCGNYSRVCTDIPLVEANKDYPGGGIGAVLPGQDYVVQFDIGLHPAVAKDILGRRLREITSCVHCPAFEEQCLEAVVTGGDMWGNLGMPAVHKKSYDCMGGCGRGCSNVISRTREDVGALDCLKHDLCSAWKSVRSGTAVKGYCHDPDCGDEAAMALYNCWRGFRLFGSLGGSRTGPFSVPVVCDREDPKIRGCWSHGGWFTQGRCKVFQGWERGQGIPDPHPLRSPIQRL